MAFFVVLRTVPLTPENPAVATAAGYNNQPLLGLVATKRAAAATAAAVSFLLFTLVDQPDQQPSRCLMPETETIWKHHKTLALAAVLSQVYRTNRGAQSAAVPPRLHLLGAAPFLLPDRKSVGVGLRAHTHPSALLWIFDAPIRVGSGNLRFCSSFASRTHVCNGTVCMHPVVADAA